MELRETKNYEEMSRQACEVLVGCLKEKPDALFCIATGTSPTETYRLFVERIREEGLDTSRMRVIALDEWFGLEPENPATCEFYIRKHVLAPLGIPDDRFLAFHAAEADGDAECRRIAELLAANGGIDCCVLGIGKNGHLGLNEPAEELNPFVHKTVLDARTKTHSMLAASDKPVSAGYTLGLKDILSSRRILLLVTGADKRDAYRTLQKKIISSCCPANYLWLHENALCLADSSCL